MEKLTDNIIAFVDTPVRTRYTINSFHPIDLNAWRTVNLFLEV